MNEWKEAILDEIALINPSETLKKGLQAKKIAMEDLQPFVKKVLRYSIDKFNGGMKFRNGDTVVARITPCLENGKTAYIDILDDGEVGFGSTEYIVIRERENISDKQYLYYFAISQEFRDVAILSMTGSSGRQRVQTDVVKKHTFFLPSLPEQRSIASVLSSLDDKIDLLHRQNKTLEAIAETLFRQWFVEEAGEEWENCKIKDFDAIVTDFVANGSFASLAKHVKYKSEKDYAVLIRLTDYNNDFNGDFVYIDENAYNFLRKSKLFGGEIIISNVGEYSGTVFRCPKLKRPMSLGPNSIVIKSDYNLFLYLFFTSRGGQFLLDGIISGSAQPKFNKTTFREIAIRYKSKEYLIQFENNIKVYFERIDLNNSQIHNLEILRDTLLPKLIRGEVRVDR